MAINASRHGVVILAAACMGMYQVKYLSVSRFHLQCQCWNEHGDQIATHQKIKQKQMYKQIT